MDILAHGLWTAGAALPLRRRVHRPLSLGWAISWGVFPDVFSFAIPALIRIWWYLSGTTSSLLPGPNSGQHFPLSGRFIMQATAWSSLRWHSPLHGFSPGVQF